MQTISESNYEAIANFKFKISEDQLKECINNCLGMIEENGLLYCTNKKCRTHKKRVNTRKKNVMIRSKWYAIEYKMDMSKNKLYENPAFPYLILEAIIEHIYDEDIKNVISNRLGVPTSKLKTEGLTNLYKLSGADIKSIIEITVLRMIGLKRAEQIVKTKIN